MHQDRTVNWQLGQLDALRGLAVLGVVIVHSLYMAPRVQFYLTPTASDLIYCCQRGVQLFFIVSAFTLALSHERRRSERRPWLNFFLRRFFRIAPMFYVALILAAASWPDVSGGPHAMLRAASFTNGFSRLYANLGTAGGWSVADEAIFYAVFPLLIVLTRNVRWAMWTLLVVALVSRELVVQLVEHQPFYTTFWSFTSIIAELPVFVLGIAAFHIWRSIDTAPQLRRTLSAWSLVLSCLILWTLVPFVQDQLLPQSVALTLFALALALHPWRLFVNRVTIFLGKISFSLYLLHFYPYRWMYAHSAPYASTHNRNLVAVVLEILLDLAVTVPVAWLTWHFIEKPGIDLGRRIIARLEGRPSSGVPPLQSVEDVPAAQF